MNSPVCHPTHEEARELRALLIDTVHQAAINGYAHSAFHSFVIEALRMPTLAADNQETDNAERALVEVTVKQADVVLDHEIQIIRRQPRASASRPGHVFLNNGSREQTGWKKH